MKSEIEKKYDAFYGDREAEHVYPVEFVMRAFLGTYPRLKTDKSELKGRRILDLGFGDGRNMPLLANLGMEVHGLEITDDICRRGRERMQRIGVKIETRVGRNHDVPYDTAYFDHLLACHACYYVDPGTKFADNVKEIARVLKPGGLFIFSAPIGTSYIMSGAKDLGEGHMEICNDPFGIRNGYVLKKFDEPLEIEEALRPYFSDFKIGSCRNDWWGIEEHVWTAVCRRTNHA